MIAFGVCVSDEAQLQRWALPGIRRHGGDDAVLFTTRDAASIFRAYNEILDRAAVLDDLEALVLLHQDTEIADPQLLPKLRERLADPEVGVVGVVGARGITGLRWWEGETRGRVVETRATLDFGGADEPVDGVDGLLMALSPWVVRNLRFDERTYAGFHAYDLDLCFEGRRAGRRVIVAPLEVVHHTKGGYGDEAAFERAAERFHRKWIAPAGDGAGAAPPAAGVRSGDASPEDRYYDHERPELVARVPAGARRVLDVGCGSGAVGAAIKRDRGAEVMGIELFPEAADVAETRLDRLFRLDLNAMTELPLPDGHFDAMVCGDVLEHVLDPERVLGVLARYLAPGGALVASIPNVRHWHVLYPLLGHDRWTYADAGLLDRTHVHFFTLTEALEMLQRADLGDVRAVEALEVAPAGPRERAIVDHLTAAAEAMGADPADAGRRLTAYQYLIVAGRPRDDREGDGNGPQDR